MKITDVEAIYVRIAQVKVNTDAGITGIDEVDSNPMAAKGAIENWYEEFLNRKE